MPTTDEYTHLHIPLSNDGMTMRTMHIHLPQPMTPQEWKQLHDTLEAMRPALVASPPAQPYMTPAPVLPHAAERAQHLQPPTTSRTAGH